MVDGSSCYFLKESLKHDSSETIDWVNAICGTLITTRLHVRAVALRSNGMHITCILHNVRIFN